MSTYYGTDDADHLSYDSSYSGFLGIWGYGGADYLEAILDDGIGSLQADLHGGSGNDYLHAALIMNETPSSYEEKWLMVANLWGGAGDDTIQLEVSAAYPNQKINISGGSGDDEISVLSGASSVFGDENHNTHAVIDGGEGDNSIILSLSIGGYQTLFPSNPGIFLEVSTGGGVDEIEGLVVAGAGCAESVIYSGGGDDRIDVEVVAGSEFGQSALTEAHGGAGDDFIRLTTWASEYADTHATATSYAYGGSGNDRIEAGAAPYDNGSLATHLFGNTGNDTLRGSDSTDYLTGGAGRDCLTGGAGDDVFVFKAARGWAGADRVQDFHVGEDKLDLSALPGSQSFGDTLWVTEAKHSAASILHAIDAQGDELIVVLRDGHGVSAADYSSSDFVL